MSDAENGKRLTGRGGGLKEMDLKEIGRGVKGSVESYALKKSGWTDMFTGEICVCVCV